MRKDPVTPELIEIVRRRDRSELAKFIPGPVEPLCIAPVIDPIEFGKCWGRTTYDHVKDQLRMGVRAESDANHLVSLCQGHTEDGMKAGRIWNVAHRPELREYLARVALFCPRCNAAVRSPTCWFCGLGPASLAPSRPETAAGASASRSGSYRRQRPF